MDDCTATEPAVRNSGEQDSEKKLVLPGAPDTETGSVKAWSEPVKIASYLPAAPDQNPLFLEKRVYQGSSGRVYPLPCIDRVSTEPVLKLWEAVHLENEYLRLMILPEIGGRIHIGLDKRNGYDFFYRQNVIKPALVGLAGPWISGGVEFNWPQHHRPATFMPVHIAIEREPDGAVTVWCGDHDPMQRMKGMHGVRLRPCSAVVELRVRLYNRTQRTQTFLWWANVAARVHERYQSFFPPDVRFVADHAKRAVTEFPLSNRSYYGIDYPGRAADGVPMQEQPPCFQPDGSYAANDLSWYANIPVPTSYMITGTRHNFFGGYDHKVDAGFVHVANHHVAPGKKQWTWGNHEFGYAWDRSLTDADGPYIELMAGVYTDNQPDFSWLAPGETKTFSQFWYPLAATGVPQAAGVDAALHLHGADGKLHIKIGVTRRIEGATLTVSAEGTELFRLGDLLLDPRHGLNQAVAVHVPATACTVELRDAAGMLARYAPTEDPESTEPAAATEPAMPEEIESLEQLYLTGVYLAQYRHATRDPEPYWQEALRRDEGDSRCNTALGNLHLIRGECRAAAEHFRRAMQRLTERTPNPADGEPFYLLGLTLRLLQENEAAYASLYKATWVSAWRAPAYHALAEMDSAAGRWDSAYNHLQRSLTGNADNNNAASLMIVVLNRLGRPAEAETLLQECLQRDPLDDWLHFLEADHVPAVAQNAIDLALDLMRSGLYLDAQRVFESVEETGDGSYAAAQYLLAWMFELVGDAEKAARTGALAAAASAKYVFPNRAEEMLALEAACRRNPEDARAHYYLGNFFYDRKRHGEAIVAWERAAQLDPHFPTVWRNLGIGRFNVKHDAAATLDAYEQAFSADPTDARVLYERDQLWKRTGVAAETRLAELERYADLVHARDDLSVERAALLNHTGRADEALELLLNRHFQPWEGGEGLVLGQYVASRLLLGRRALDEQQPELAVNHFMAAMQPPQNLSEARHLLANQANVQYWLGVALDAVGDQEAAQRAFFEAAHQRGDFQQMRVESISEMTYWSALALRRLKQDDDAEELLQCMYAYAEELAASPARIDFFATSLPTMLLFEEDIQAAQNRKALLLKAQALLGLGRRAEAQDCVRALLLEDNHHMHAAELLHASEADKASC
jgi:tetratricopeptide (TPR) repeat protein